MKLKQIVLAGAMAFALMGTAQAQVAVPHTFTDGTPAVAAQVNANFSALVGAINTLSDRVDALENGGVADTDVTGVYRIVSTQSEFFGETTPLGYVEQLAYVMQGQLQIQADNTWTLTGSEFEHAFIGIGDLQHDEAGRYGSQALDIQMSPDSFNISGSWTRNDATLTLTLPGEGDVVDFRISVGGDVLLAANLERGSEGGYSHGQAGVTIAIKTGNP